MSSGGSLNPDGSFSTVAPLGAVEDHICRLRAIPPARSRAIFAPFAGPRVATGERRDVRVQGGPNVGKVFDFYLGRSSGPRRSSTARSAAARCSQATCSTPTLNQTTDTFFCDAWFTRFDAPAATRFELRIDGANAYPRVGGGRHQRSGAACLR